MSILVETEREREKERAGLAGSIFIGIRLWKGRGGDWGWPAGEMNESRGARNSAREIET